MRIAVIIPTYCEERMLPVTLAALHQHGRSATVIVADCGSTDETTRLAREAGATVLHGPELVNRASAMNAGATWVIRNEPDIEALWFLHADTAPPPEWDCMIAEVLADQRVVGGAFRMVWNRNEIPRWMRVRLGALALINRMRYELTSSYFGDQGIFVRRTAFERIGGFPDVPLLEDVVLCRALRGIGVVRLAPATVVTSPRRFVRHGPIRQSLLDLGLLTAERLGLQPTRIHAWYNRERE